MNIGPRGMDKLIHSHDKVTITNDGATVIDLLEIVHPAAKTLVDIAKAQDKEMGDGTTSVVVFAGELMKEAKQFIEEGVHSQIIMKGYRMALRECISRLKEVAIAMDETPQRKREMLLMCAETALNSKLIANEKTFFGEMIVKAVEQLDDDMDKDLIGIKKITGGSITDSFLVDGVGFAKTFSYAGFEQQPKSFKNPKLVLLNLELELKSEKENAEIRIENPDDYQAIVDAEWHIIYEKLEKIVSVGAKVVLSKLPIGDLATQYFADRNIFCAGRVPIDDLKRVAKATGGLIQSSVHGLTEAVLGECGEFEEKALGVERFNLFKQCKAGKSATIVLRGGAEQFIDEAQRSLNDAIMVVRRAHHFSELVAGGGSIEMELSRHLREYLRTVPGKQQLIINSFAKALEVIPRTIAENAGLDSTDLINKLRQKHAMGSDAKWIGLDIQENNVCNCFDKFIWEPMMLKLNVLNSAAHVLLPIYLILYL